MLIRNTKRHNSKCKTRETKTRKKSEKSYHHSKHRIGRLKAIRTFLPQKPLSLHRRYIPANSLLRLRHYHIPKLILMLRRQRLRNTQSTNSGADDHTIKHRISAAVGIQVLRRRIECRDRTSGSPPVTAGFRSSG